MSAVIEVTAGGTVTEPTYQFSDASGSSVATFTADVTNGKITASGVLEASDVQTTSGASLNGKMNAMSVDSSPSDGSSNLVTSDGVYDALKLITLGLYYHVGEYQLGGSRYNADYFFGALTKYACAQSCLQSESSGPCVGWTRANHGGSCSGGDNDLCGCWGYAYSSLSSSLNLVDPGGGFHSYVLRKSPA